MTLSQEESQGKRVKRRHLSDEIEIVKARASV